MPDPPPLAPARFLGFETRYEFEDFLAAHHAPRNYTLADLEHDRETASSDIRSSATLNVTGKTRTIQVKDRAFLSTATVGQSQSH